MSKQAKYVFVTGGVVSSLGKGITAASLGRLLKSRGLKVSLQKFDPYINVDPGTMSPFQHGEVFVTEDGAETDLDLGHYERFVDEFLSRNSNHTTGSIYNAIIRKERKGEYLGSTVQVIPHVTDEIKRRIQRVAQSDEVDVVITEIGGTVGDIESLPFLEAIRQFRNQVGRDNAMYIHCTLVPVHRGGRRAEDQAHAALRSGAAPDRYLAGRDRLPLQASARARDPRQDRPVRRRSGRGRDLGVRRGQHLRDPADDAGAGPRPAGLRPAGPRHRPARHARVGGRGRAHPRAEGVVKIAIVGKYVQLQDAYLSVVEALNHSAIHHGTKLEIIWVDAETVSKEESERKLQEADGVLIPGGFGIRGIEGKIAAARFARENDVPYLGVCLGMQVAVVEFARHVVGLDGANSSEFDAETPYPVIDLLPEQKEVEDMGGTMRLGADSVTLVEGRRRTPPTVSAVVQERHRHRYEVNNQLRSKLVAAGLLISGTYQDERLVEVIELPDHPWFVASQYHPEFKSRPNRPQPLFRDFVGAAVARRAGVGVQAGNVSA